MIIPIKTELVNMELTVTKTHDLSCTLVNSHLQASTPVEVPQMKSKITEDSKRREFLFRQPLAQSDSVLVSHPTGDSVAPSETGSKNGPRRSTAEPFQRAHPLSKQETDHLDEELDLLLNLDAPVDTQNRPVSGALSYNRSTEKDLKSDCKENGKVSLLPSVPLVNFYCSLFW